MIVAQTAERSIVAGAVRHGPLHPEIFSREGALAVNQQLAELGIDAWIDHCSLEAQDIGLEPQSQIGAPAQRIETRSVGEGIEAADRAGMHREIAHNNGARIIADPSIALDAITYKQSTFTRRDMAIFAHTGGRTPVTFDDIRAHSIWNQILIGLPLGRCPI